MTALKLTGVSDDFPKLIKTLASFGNKKFDYWDDLLEGIYKNSENPQLHLLTYYNTPNWVVLNKKHYPNCPDLLDDWSYIEGRYVTNVDGTKYVVNQKKLQQSKLREYVNDENIPILATI
ncbi:MAG: hypothetical protein WD512_03185 [Candidatus Paceibacterota bacterium]